MATLEITPAEELAPSAHGSEDPPARIEEQEFDLLAFELWHLGSCPGLVELDEWEDQERTVASRASCL